MHGIASLPVYEWDIKVSTLYHEECMHAPGLLSVLLGSLGPVQLASGQINSSFLSASKTSS